MNDLRNCDLSLALATFVIAFAIALMGICRPILNKDMVGGSVIVEQSVLPPPVHPDPMSIECRKHDDAQDICRI